MLQWGEERAHLSRRERRFSKFKYYVPIYCVSSACEASRQRQLVAPKKLIAMLRVFSTLVACCAAAPSVTLTNGVKPGAIVSMPALAAGTAGYQGANATAAVQRALKAGFTHLHTAFDYFNLVPLGLGLRGVPRSSYFLSSMTSPCIHPAAPPKRNVTDPQGCHDLTITEVQSVLDELKLPTLDLLMLHGPSEAFGHIGGCSPLACALARAQWSAYETLLTSGKVRAIGVSNFCQSCLACLNGSKFAPAVNQIQVHVGQGSADPGPGLLSYCVSTRARRHEFAMPSMKDCLAGWLAGCLPACLPARLHPQPFCTRKAPLLCPQAKRGIVVQAYEPLAGGALAKDSFCAAIGLKHNKSAAQVALRWVLQRAPTVVVRAGSDAHLRQDLDLFDFSLDASDLKGLDERTQPKGEAGGRCSWGCTE